MVSEWFKNFRSRPIWGVRLGGWLLIVILLASLAGIIKLTVRQNSDPKIEEIEAEIERVWMVTIEDETGGHQVQNMRLVQGEQSFSCRVSPIVAGRIYGLELNRPYQFTVNFIGNRCYIIEVMQTTER